MPPEITKWKILQMLQVVFENEQTLFFEHIVEMKFSLYRNLIKYYFLRILLLKDSFEQTNRIYILSIFNKLIFFIMVSLKMYVAHIFYI